MSKPAASVDHELSIIPCSECLLRDHLERAVGVGLELALQLGVARRLTEDRIHFPLLAAPQKRARYRMKSAYTASRTVRMSPHPARLQPLGGGARQRVWLWVEESLAEAT